MTKKEIIKAFSDIPTTFSLEIEGEKIPNSLVLNFMLYKNSLKLSTLWPEDRNKKQINDQAKKRNKLFYWLAYHTKNEIFLNYISII